MTSPAPHWDGVRSTRPEVWTEQADRDRFFWVTAQLRADPQLTVRLRVQPTGEGRTGVTGILFERADAPVTARDLRAAPVGELIEVAKNLSGWAPPAGIRLRRPSRPGPRGHPPEHYDAVWNLWQAAQTADPAAPIQWLRRQWDPPISDATMRRWRDQAVAGHAAATGTELPAPAPPPEWVEGLRVGPPLRPSADDNPRDDQEGSTP
jgi:hypothetical protein